MSLRSHFERAEQLLIEHECLRLENEKMKQQQRQFVNQLSAQLKTLTRALRNCNEGRMSRPQVRFFKSSDAQRQKLYNFGFLLLVVIALCYHASRIQMCYAIDIPLQRILPSYEWARYRDSSVVECIDCAYNLDNLSGSLDSGLSGLIE